MTERDAFGRESGEDTLAEAGWRAPVPATVPAVEPAPGPSPPAEPPVDRTPHPGRRGSRAPKVIVLFLLAFFALVVVGLVLTVSSIVRSIDEGIGDLGLPDVDAVITGPERVRVPESPAGGLEPGSLLRADRFGPALARLRRGGGRALTLRLAPDRIDTQLRDGRHMRVVQIGADGRLDEIARTRLTAGVPEIDLSRVDPAAPQRLLRSAQRRFGLAPARVDYLVLMDLGDDPVWNAFYRGGAVHLQARLDGTITRRVS